MSHCAELVGDVPPNLPNGCVKHLIVLKRGTKKCSVSMCLSALSGWKSPPVLAVVGVWEPYPVYRFYIGHWKHKSARLEGSQRLHCSPAPPPRIHAKCMPCGSCLAMELLIHKDSPKRRQDILIGFSTHPHLPHTTHYPTRHHHPPTHSLSQPL